MTQVFIEEEEAFVFESGAEVIKLDDSRAYRHGVQPWMGCPCVDFIIRADDRLVLLEAKNYDRPALAPGTVPAKLKTLPDICGGKALGALTIAGRWGLRDLTNAEFGWERAICDLLDQGVSFGLYVRLPAARRYTGARADRQRQRVERALAHLSRQLQRTNAVGWLTVDVHLVQRDSLRQIPGLVAVEPAPRLWDGETRHAFVDALERCPAFDDAGQRDLRPLRKGLRALRDVLPDGWSKRMPDLGDARDPLSRSLAQACLRGELDWLDADHADRRDESGRSGLIPWAHAAVDRFLDGDSVWHRRIDGEG